MSNTRIIKIHKNINVLLGPDIFSKNFQETVCLIMLILKNLPQFHQYINTDPRSLEELSRIKEKLTALTQHDACTPKNKQTLQGYAHITGLLIRFCKLKKTCFNGQAPGFQWEYEGKCYAHATLAAGFCLAFTDLKTLLRQAQEQYPAISTILFASELEEELRKIQNTIKKQKKNKNPNKKPFKKFEAYLSFIEKNINKNLEIPEPQFESVYQVLWAALYGDSPIVQRCKQLIKYGKTLHILRKQFGITHKKEVHNLRQLYFEHANSFKTSHFINQAAQKAPLEIFNEVSTLQEILLFTPYLSFDNLSFFPNQNRFLKFYRQYNDLASKIKALNILLQKWDNFEGGSPLKSIGYFYLWQYQYIQKISQANFLYLAKTIGVERIFTELINTIVLPNRAGDDFLESIEVLTWLNSELLKSPNELQPRKHPAIQKYKTLLFNTFRLLEEKFQNNFNDINLHCNLNPLRNAKKTFLSLRAYKNLLTFVSQKAKPTTSAENRLGYDSDEGRALKQFIQFAKTAFQHITSQLELERSSRRGSDIIAASELETLTNQLQAFKASFVDDMQQISKQLLGDQHDEQMVASLLEWFTHSPSTPTSNQIEGPGIIESNQTAPEVLSIIEKSSSPNKQTLEVPKPEQEAEPLLLPFCINFFDRNSPELQYHHYSLNLEKKNQTPSIQKHLKDAQNVIENYRRQVAELEERLLTEALKKINPFYVQLEIDFSLEEQIKHYQIHGQTYLDNCTTLLNKALPGISDTIGRKAAETACQNVLKKIKKEMTIQEKQAAQLCKTYTLKIQEFEKKIKLPQMGDITAQNASQAMRELNEIQTHFHDLPKIERTHLKKCVETQFMHIFQSVETSLTGHKSLTWLLDRLENIKVTSISALVQAVKRVQTINPNQANSFYPSLKAIFLSYQFHSIDKKEKQALDEVYSKCSSLFSVPTFSIDLTSEVPIEEQMALHEKRLVQFNDSLKFHERQITGYVFKRIQDNVIIQIACAKFLAEYEYDTYQKTKTMVTSQINDLHLTKTSDFHTQLQTLKRLHLNLNRWIKQDADALKRDIQEKLNTFFNSLHSPTLEDLHWILNQLHDLSNEENHPIKPLIRSIQTAHIKPHESAVLFPVLLEIYKQNQCEGLLEKNDAHLSEALKNLQTLSHQSSPFMNWVIATTLIILGLILVTSLLALFAPSLGLMVIFTALEQGITQLIFAASAYLIGAGAAASVTGTLTAISIGSAAGVTAGVITTLKSVGFYREKTHQATLRAIYHQTENLLNLQSNN